MLSSPFEDRLHICRIQISLKQGRLRAFGIITTSICNHSRSSNGIKLMCPENSFMIFSSINVRD